MSWCNHNRGGMDDSLLFFFLLLVLLFCNPGAFGCGNNCCETECC
ncbi:MAG: hypothetical protein UC961_08975 [Emergencia sp.]|nr:hypothetical protein [Emergencia sp.]